MNVNIGGTKTKNFMACLCSVPVEGDGTKLDRLRSEGSLGIVPKIAIISLVKWMERHGYSRDNYDFYDIDMLYPPDEEIRNYFKNLNPDVVGLSAVVSTSYSQVKRISKIIKQECPDCFVVMGGNLAASSEAILFNTQVDFTIVGDGEIAWVHFLDYIKNNRKNIDFKELKKIAGICFIDETGDIYFEQHGEKISAHDIPFPDYDLLKIGIKSKPDLIANYFRKGLTSGWFNLDERAYEIDRPQNIAGIFSSKGCVAKCTFCQRSTKGYRCLSLDGLKSHLKYLNDNCQVGFIQILDENFGSNKKHSYKFAEILWKHNMLWVATGVRCTSITEDDIIFYKKHGCSALQFGVESGSQDILDLMEKKFTITDVHKAINYCIQHGLYSPLAVMLGMPGENMETAKQTGQLIGNIAARIGVSPQKMGYDTFYALPLPGTPLFYYGLLSGVISSKPKDVGKYLERVSNAGTYKRYYINLNGSRVSDVIFWDILVGLEASRSYRKNKKKQIIDNNVISRRYVEALEKIKSSNPRYGMKYKVIKFTDISYFIDNYFIDNYFIDSLPRFIIYPVIKWLNCIEYIIQKNIKSNLVNNIFLEAKLNPPLIDLLVNGNKGVSLRHIISDFEDYFLHKSRTAKDNDISVLLKNKPLLGGM